MTRHTLAAARGALVVLAALAILGPGAARAGAATGLRLDLEGGPAWQTRNDFAIPGDTGTRVRLDDGSPVAAFRGTLTWDFGDRWSMRVLAAPLSTETDFVADTPITFEGITFSAGTPLRQSYVFDSYRLSFFYRFRSAGPWSFRAGGTAKVRAASTEVTGGGQSAGRDDLGVVPLLYAGARYDRGGRVAFDAELDGLGAPQGRAIDLALRVELRASERARPYLGYRLLDGGADNDEVYSFATFHYALAGVSMSF
jgi:hypothetical protein